MMGYYIIAGLIFIVSLYVSNKKEGVVYLEVTRGTREDVLKILEDLNENEFPVEFIEGK